MSDQKTGQQPGGQDQNRSTYKKPIPTKGPPRKAKESSDQKPASASSKESNKGQAKSSESNSKQKNSGSSDSGQKPGDSNTSGQAKNQEGGSKSGNRRRRRRRGGNKGGAKKPAESRSSESKQNKKDQGNQKRRSSGGRRKRGSQRPVSQIVGNEAVELDEEELKQRRGRSRKGRPVGRYMMVVSRRSDATHIAILEGRTLIEYYVSRPSDDVFQIHGNIYYGRVQNVLPGMEAAFVDIGTPKNAVIYRNDVLTDGDSKDRSSKPKIEQMLKSRQAILCQVAKNPIAHKGARLTGEVSLPGRFVVLVPNSTTYGISKRLPDAERKRLRKILDRVRPKGHGLIVRTAAENVTAGEIERDVAGLSEQWAQIEQMAKSSKAPSLIYREPDMAVRVIREEFNKGYRNVIIDDRELHDEVAEYVSVITPALADRVEYYDRDKENLDVLERYHIHEQLHKALDKKVWLPSGGSLIIERTEALTVIDVNTGKNVGSSNLEDTVFQNNIEAAEGIAQQLRLRDIGGIIVIDFVDMENKKNRAEVMKVFRAALARDKTRTQAFEISELGLVEMTRKRIGEGLLESMSSTCPQCDGLGHEITSSVLRKQNR